MRIKGEEHIDMVRPCAMRGISVPTRSDKMVVSGATRTPGRSTRSWIEAAKKDMIVVNLTEELILNRELNEEKGFLNRAKQI